MVPCPQRNGERLQNTLPHLPAPPTMPTSAPTPKTLTIRRLSNQEYQDLRNKGLCFRCKQPYSPLQECLKKEVRALLWGEDKDINIEDFEALELDDTVPTVDPNAHLSRLELPLYSVGGISGPRMMKLHGFLNGTAILVMIDSGASHNFLSQELFAKLHLPIDT